jgi:hypothetical protein
MTDEMGAFAEMVDKRGNKFGFVIQAECGQAGPMRRSAVATKIRRDDMETGFERPGHRAPLPARAAGAMQEHDWLPSTSRCIAEADISDFDGVHDLFSLFNGLIDIARSRTCCGAKFLDCSKMGCRPGE